MKSIRRMGALLWCAVLLLGGLTASVAGAALVLKIPASLFNGAVAIIIAPPLCLALRKALQKTNIQMP